MPFISRPGLLLLLRCSFFYLSWKFDEIRWFFTFTLSLAVNFSLSQIFQWSQCQRISSLFGLLFPSVWLSGRKWCKVTTKLLITKQNFKKKLEPSEFDWVPFSFAFAKVWQNSELAKLLDWFLCYKTYFIFYLSDYPHFKKSKKFVLKTRQKLQQG